MCKKTVKISSGLVAWRFLKGMIFISCLALFLHQSTRFLVVYYQYPTKTKIEFAYPDEIELPAVTICSRNPMKKSIFCAEYPDMCESPKNITKFCKEYPFMCKENPSNPIFPKFPPEDPLKFVEAVQKIYSKRNTGRKILEEVNWSIDTPMEMQNEMKPVFILSLMYYPCYTQNLLLNDSGEPKKIRIGADFSKQFFMYDVNIERSEELSFRMEPEVFISIHSPFDPVNPLYEGKTLTLGKKYKIFIRLREDLQLPYPYKTNCINYNDLWSKNNRQGPRSQKMCKEMCLHKLYESNRNLKLEFKMMEYPLELCIGEECETSLESEKFLKDCKNNCKANCRYLQYIITRTEIEQESSKKEISGYDYERNQIEIKVFLGDRQVVVQRHVPLYNRDYVFSYIGGLMGYWLGVSVWAFAGIAENVVRRSRRLMHRIKTKIKLF